jgi:putative toxin-antitoxin system antitoxin component (TIGR02293 family)
MFPLDAWPGDYLTLAKSPVTICHMASRNILPDSKEHMPKEVQAYCRRVLSAVKPSGHNHVLLLGLGSRSVATTRLLQEIEEGLLFEHFETFRQNIGLSMTELGDLLQISPRTLNRRSQEGRLQPDESDRLVRAARIFGKVLELFEGDLLASRNWLKSPQRGLGGVSPVEMARTELGAREVEDLIGRLEHGVFS